MGLINLNGQDIECCRPGNALLDAGTPGVSPHTYVWSNSSTNQTLLVLSPNSGIYTVTVTDATGCTGTNSFEVAFCSQLVVTTSVVDNTSCSTPNGSATATPSGGCGTTYTYEWDSVPPQTTATATGLSGGTYNVTVTSMSSTGALCTQIESVTIQDSTPPLNVTITGFCN